MKVVNEDKMFNLKSVTIDSGLNSILLELEPVSEIPRKFDEQNFKKIKLNLIGCRESDKVFKKLKEFEDNFIDIEQLENGNLDIWSESIQIIVIELENFKETVEEYSKKDWILEYESLCKVFYRNYDLNAKNQVITRRFEERLQHFLEEELRRIELKNQLVSSSKFERMKELANQILNLFEQYKIEKKGNGS